MNIAGMGAVYSAMYQHTAKVQNTATDKTSFSNQLQNAGSVGKTEVEAYTENMEMYLFRVLGRIRQALTVLEEV